MGFKAQVAEMLRLTRELDTKTIRYDWFINEDGTECEVHEAYLAEEGLVEHNMHVMEARAVLFEKYAYDHRMTAFGDVSQELRELGRAWASSPTSSLHHPAVICGVPAWQAEAACDRPRSGFGLRGFSDQRTALSHAGGAVVRRAASGTSRKITTLRRLGIEPRNYLADAPPVAGGRGMAR